MGYGRYTLRLIGRIDDDLPIPLLYGKGYLPIGLVVAVQHQAASGGTGRLGNQHLAQGTGIDVEAPVQHDPHDFLAQEGLACVADLGGGRWKTAAGGLPEGPGPVGHEGGVHQVERGAVPLSQILYRDAPDIHCTGIIPPDSGRPDITQGRPLFFPLIHGTPPWQRVLPVVVRVTSCPARRHPGGRDRWQ